MTVSIVIEFPDEESKNEFLGQVSDGAMENMCDINPLDAEKSDDGRWNKPWGGATKFEIKMLPRSEWF